MSFYHANARNNKSHVSTVSTVLITKVSSSLSLSLSFLLLSFGRLCTPGMFHDLADCQSLIDFTIQHCLDQVNALFTHDPRDP